MALGMVAQQASAPIPQKDAATPDQAGAAAPVQQPNSSPAAGPTASSSEATAPTAPPIYRVPSEYAYFTAQKRDMPPYPPEAVRKKIAGDVILAVRYSPDGNVEALQRIVGDPILVKAAIQAVTNWKFQPVKENGEKAGGPMWDSIFWARLRCSAYFLSENGRRSPYLPKIGPKGRPGLSECGLAPRSLPVIASKQRSRDTRRPQSACGIRVRLCFAESLINKVTSHYSK